MNFKEHKVNWDTSEIWCSHGMNIINISIFLRYEAAQFHKNIPQSFLQWRWRQYNSGATTAPLFFTLLVMRKPEDSLKPRQHSDHWGKRCVSRGGWRGCYEATPNVSLLYSGMPGGSEWYLTPLLPATLFASNQVRPPSVWHSRVSKQCTGHIASSGLPQRQRFGSIWETRGGQGCKVTAILSLHVKVKATFY
jgi:hypothetical protein